MSVVIVPFGRIYNSPLGYKVSAADNVCLQVRMIFIDSGIDDADHYARAGAVSKIRVNPIYAPWRCWAGCEGAGLPFPDA